VVHKLWNSRSLVNKLKHFNSFIHASNYKIFGITETWLANHIYDNKIFPPNFTVYHKNHLSRGGGVMLAKDTSIPSNNIEVVTVEILVVECVYCIILQTVKLIIN